MSKFGTNRSITLASLTEHNQRLSSGTRTRTTGLPFPREASCSTQCRQSRVWPPVLPRTTSSRVRKSKHGPGNEHVTKALEMERKALKRSNTCMMSSPYSNCQNPLCYNHCKFVTRPSDSSQKKSTCHVTAQSRKTAKNATTSCRKAFWWLEYSDAILPMYY